MMCSNTRYVRRAGLWLAAGSGIVLLGLIAMPAVADFSHCPAVMRPYKAAYYFTYQGLRMAGKRSLQLHEDGGFILTQSAHKLGSGAKERSAFRLDDHRIRVDKYDMTRSILGIKQEYHNSYDWDNGEVRVTGSRDKILPLDERPFDALSYQLALRCDLAQGKPHVSYAVVKRNKIKRYEFRAIGEEALETNIGTLDTLVVDRVTSSGKHATRVWLAPSLNFLLVRLEKSQPGEDPSLTLEINKVTFN